MFELVLQVTWFLLGSIYFWMAYKSDKDLDKKTGMIILFICLGISAQFGISAKILHALEGLQ